jgi:hypothetical protein
VSKVKPLKLRELLKHLKPFGIVGMSKKQRGKGSEMILFKPDSSGLAFLSLVGCVSRMNEIMASWEGQNVNDLIAKWGRQPKLWMMGAVER